MMNKKALWMKVIFAGIGALVGFLYWRFIGCTSGTCPIRSVWYFSTLWGLAMGYLTGDLIGSFLFKREAKNE
jgi:hypothetical protein